MNQKDLLLRRKENLKLLDTDAYRPKINCLEVNPNNTFKHEFGKFLMYWLIRKGVQADCASTIFNTHKADALTFNRDTIAYNLDEICSRIEKFMEKNTVKLKKWQYPCSVSEAHMRDGSIRDQHILDTGQRIEIVSSCDKSVVPYDKDTIIVRV
ncbi:MAG: hypothetical protein KAJ24_04850 [Candidatus Aenigmarchaeota archaeon]|nr:hypothetical protein [Candidatus Aenigmarchaeota archaeon]